MDKEKEYQERYEELDALLFSPFLSDEDRIELLDEKIRIGAYLADLWE